MNNFITRLPGLGVIEINGADAAAFLQAQLTSDINAFADQQSQFSAWCNAAGKVIASFIITRTANRYYLILPADMLDTVCRRLKMYILRAKVELVDISESLGCLGIYRQNTDHGIDDLIKQGFSSIKISVPTDPARIILVTARDDMSSVIPDIAAHITTDEQWQILDIAAGIAWIHSQTSEQLLPQELNLEMLGGLSYNKGCYPGQEIIARLHFRGRQKRRLCTGHIETAGSVPTIGTKLPGLTEAQSAGTIINSVREPDGLVRILAVIDTEQTGNSPLRLSNGELLHFIPVSTSADGH